MNSEPNSAMRIEAAFSEARKRQATIEAERCLQGGIMDPILGRFVSIAELARKQTGAKQ